MRLLPGNDASLAWGLSIVTALGLGAAGTIWGLRGDLPDPIATHFHGTAADGFSSVAVTALQAAIFAIAPSACVVVLAVLLPGGRWIRRLVFGSAIGWATFVTGVYLATTLSQLGLANANSAPVSWAAFVVPGLAGLVLGGSLAQLIRK